MAREIPLTRGLVAIVDDEDYEWLSQWKWCADTPSRARSYARRRERARAPAIYMHRIIVGAERGQFVDHINGNPLDNRRANLRLCSRAENNRNQTRLTPGKSSAYKGVCWDKREGRWKSCITLGEKHRHIGYFATEVEAARAYDAKAIELFGEFACTNEMLGLYEKEPACPVEAATKPDTRA